MRSLLLPLLVLSGCSRPLTNEIDWIIHGERTGLFEEVTSITCEIRDELIGREILRIAEIDFFFRRLDDILSFTVRSDVTPGPAIGAHERVVFAGSAVVLTDADPDAPVDGGDGSAFHPVAVRYEHALGPHVPEYVNGEVSPVRQIEMFLPILRIGEDQTVPDANTGEPLAIEGTIEDVRMYCDSFL